MHVGCVGWRDDERHANAVTDLLLDSNRLTSSLPTELGYVNISGAVLLNANSLTGFMPTELGNIRGLTDYFWLQSNLLTGGVPSQLGQLDRFAGSMKLSSNALSRELPSEISQLDSKRGLGMGELAVRPRGWRIETWPLTPKGAAAALAGRRSASPQA